MRIRLLPAMLLCGACATSSARLVQGPSAEIRVDARERAQIALSIEALDALETENVDSVTLELRAPELGHDLQPMLGITAAEDDSLYAYLGSRWNLELNALWRLSPGFAVGFFDAGDLLDLGNELEFRSSVELSRQLGPPGWRMALELYHLSNGSISDHNPGTEGLVLRYMASL